MRFMLVVLCFSMALFASAGDSNVIPRGSLDNSRIQFQTQKKHIRSLLKKGGLKNWIPAIPTTIRGSLSFFKIKAQASELAMGEEVELPLAVWMSPLTSCRRVYVTSILLPVYLSQPKKGHA